MSHVLLSSLNVGDEFEGYYYLERVFEKQTKTNKPYTEAVLRDRSGDITARMWKTTDIEKGSFVFVKGRAEEYQGVISFILTKMEETDDVPNMEDIVPSSETKENDISVVEEDVVEFLKDNAEETGDKTCFLLYNTVFTEKVREVFYDIPCGTSPQYGVVGGLLACTARTVRQSFSMSGLYGLNKKEKAILIVSALLHKIGCMDAYDMGCVASKKKDAVLFGVDYLTDVRVALCIRRIGRSKKHKSEIDSETFRRIIHCVRSWNEKTVLPMTREAIVLANICRADFQLVRSRDVITEDVGSDDFTSYDSILERKFYKV